MDREAIRREDERTDVPSIMFLMVSDLLLLVSRGGRGGTGIAVEEERRIDGHLDQINRSTVLANVLTVW